MSDNGVWPFPGTKQQNQRLFISVSLEDAELMTAARYVVEHWIFPLSTLDLKLAKVDLEDLRAERNWRMAREMGIDDDYG